MLRMWLLLGVTVTAGFVACAGDDAKRKVYDTEAGAAGVGGEPPFSAGGSSVDGGAGGDAPSAAGMGGATPLGGAAGAGGQSGSAGDGVGGESSGGSAGSADAGAAGLAGAGGEGPVNLSQFCQPGYYQGFDVGCLACGGQASIEQRTCAQALLQADLQSTEGAAETMVLRFSESLREALPTEVSVVYENPAQTLSHVMSFSFTDARYRVDISEGPDVADTITVQPFIVDSVCGDTFELTTRIRFTRQEGSFYSASCPDDS